MLLLTDGWNFVYFLAQSNQSSSSTAESLISFIVGIAAYIFSSYCFYKIYQRLGEPNAWFAWVPILNNWIMYKAGDQSPWWIIGIFIPLVNIVALIILLIAFVNIVKKLGKNPWLILLMIVPLINFVVLYNFAFG